ncbi:glycosyl transferase family 1 [Aliiruegeria haliotis]|uniref:Glycosyl transferase family 1 n=1 Tax=Aliiruegeria haliotis TaxID=1280846 RepID=A0A2T0RL01_9RHOB|nr:glycosyltransferase family 4 protein [Aliiruegeria haliotis]PRY21800.1 glycosyl transferase family 1 [Aliiruegeria haliotis]
MERQHLSGIVLVVPAIGLDPRTGGGQRSRLFAEAAGQLGSVSVLGVGDMSDADLRAAFPEADRVAVVRSDRVAPPMRGPIRKTLDLMHELLVPRVRYGIDPTLQESLCRLVDETGAEAVLNRYARVFLATGLPVAGPISGNVERKVPVLVDVDDRDDQRLASAFASRIRVPFLQGLFDSIVLARHRAHLKRGLARADHVWFAASEDIWQLPGTATSVAPNVASLAFGAGGVPGAASGNDLLFVGSHAHRPNRDGMRWFLETCWKPIRAAFPRTRLRLVGVGAWESLRDEGLDLEGVDIVGAVEVLDPEYARARLAICPMREASGSKVKLIEAAAYARPVVSTPESVRGFGADLAPIIPVADDPTGFVAGCCHLLERPEEAEAIGQTLKAWQERTFARSSVIRGIAQDILCRVPALSPRQTMAEGAA